MKADDLIRGKKPEPDSPNEQDTQKLEQYSQRRLRQHWFSMALAKTLLEPLGKDVREEAIALIRGRKVLDFGINRGQASAKIYDESSTSRTVDIRLPQLSANTWDRIIAKIAKSAYLTSMLLLGKVPPEMGAVFSESECSLLPDGFSELTIRINSKPTKEINRFVAALLQKLYERSHDDPISLFLLRGRGHEETFHELRKHRSLLKPVIDSPTRFGYQDVNYEKAKPIAAGVRHFWSYGKEIDTLSYNIKADELPASILRRLDTLPLEGLEDELEGKLEESYERVARLAQSYGLGL